MLAVISLFCLLVGYRLTFQKPNRYNSILSPVGWCILGSIFMLIFAFVLIEVYRGKISDDSSGESGGVLLFSLFCFFIARHVHQQKRTSTMVSKDSHSQIER